MPYWMTSGVEKQAVSLQDTSRCVNCVMLNQTLPYPAPLTYIINFCTYWNGGGGGGGGETNHNLVYIQEYSLDCINSCFFMLLDSGWSLCTSVCGLCSA